MSLNINGERLLAEALADAMDRDLADVPAKEQLKRQHRFSGKFVRRIKRIEKGIEAENGAAAGDAAKEGDTTGHGKGRPHDFAKLGKRAGHYGGMAAALVCVIGLAAFLGVTGRMGASKNDEAAFPGDMPQWEETQEKGEQEQNGTFPESAESADEAMDDPVDDLADGAMDDTMDNHADDGTGAPKEDEASTETEAGTDALGEPMAPGWQEQLLAESEKADALISWHLESVYDGMSFVLESELTDAGGTDASSAPMVSASLICEVYYREGVDEWVRVYRTNRSMSRCEPRTVWGDEYFMGELNMTKPGTYRVVRQVNSYRQVLELALERME